MSDRDTITLPREVVQEALEAFEAVRPFSTTQRELKIRAVEALRTALAAEPTKPARLHATTTGVLLGSAWLVWNTPKGANDEIMSQETADLLNRMFAENEALRRDAEKWRKAQAKYIAWQKGGKAEAMEGT